jgi:hypothetical protein
MSKTRKDRLYITSLLEVPGIGRRFRAEIRRRSPAEMLIYGPRRSQFTLRRETAPNERMNQDSRDSTKKSFKYEVSGKEDSGFCPSCATGFPFGRFRCDQTIVSHVDDIFRVEG